MRNFILGTDWWTDCDDCVALRLLLRAHARDEIRLLGVAINACMEYSAASVDGFMQQEGVTGIPIGIDREATDYGRNPPYQKRLAGFARDVLNNEMVPDALALYRRLLAEAKAPVEILEIGFHQVTGALLNSPADDISPLTGVELVAQKVKKFWVMAGKWDEDGGKEYNFCNTARTSTGAAVFCEKCPVPVTFLGWEVGHGVITGGKLQEGDFLRLALKDHGSENGRHSWDPMLVMLALVGDEEKAGYSVVRGKASLDAQTGANHFAEMAEGLHAYVVKNEPNSFYEDMINNAIR